MYKNLNFEQAIKDMQSELRFNPEFIPNLSRISTEILDLKKAEVSSAMADFMSEEFNYETFLQDPNHYIDKFLSFVAEDELNLHIARIPGRPDLSWTTRLVHSYCSFTKRCSNSTRTRCTNL